MPTKNLTTPFARDGITPRDYKFGGGANTITTENGFLADPADSGSFEFYSIGYRIDAGGGNDTIYGSDIGEPGSGGGDTLIGGTGSDTISGGLGDDIIKGGTDDNTEKFSKKNGASSNDLYGEEIAVIVSSPDTLVAGFDEITGGNGATNNMFGDYQDVTVSGTGATFTGGKDTLTSKTSPT